MINRRHYGLLMELFTYVKDRRCGLFTVCTIVNAFRFNEISIRENSE
jgi:hypothetical protein